MKPTGKVTFLFTDIEGSTRLAQEFPDSISEALDMHHSVLQNAIESNKGFVFEIIGDAFCCAFENAADAVKAAVRAQNDLQNAEWKDAVIRIRIGIHTGQAEWTGERYSGYITLASSARVMSAAYGQQILVSNETYLESADYLPANITFRDLGERRLKDIIQPVRLFQVLAEGLPSEFPPLKTLDARPNNLPVQLTSFVGRKKELSDIKNLLAQTHLITITGPGGTGKSRLAIESGADMIDEFPNGVWLVELASISDPSFICLKIAGVLGLSEKKNQNITETIIEYLKEKKLLLILDNCEHLIEGAALISESMLTSCPGLRIISTGREPMHIHGEVIYQLTSLSFPDARENFNIDNAMEYDTIRLFYERVLSVKTDFSITESNIGAIAELCRRLDGIPLAIELAAARMRSFTIDNILDNIKNRFRFLTSRNRTALPRQQTLKAMIDWSYELLSEKEKIYFKNLSVFTGGASEEAISEVCFFAGDDEYESLEILSGLEDKSLLKTNTDKGSIRFYMLETIRLYGKEKLSEEGNTDDIYGKYFSYFFELATGPVERFTGADQKKWIRVFESETDNFRECMKWSLEHDPVSALKMSIALGIFWAGRGSFAEGFDLLTASMERSGITDGIEIGRAYLWKGFYKLHQGQYDEAEKYLSKSVELLRKMNETSEIANPLTYLATISIYKNDLENAKKYQEECLVIRLKNNDKRGIAGSMNGLGQIYHSEKEFEKARDILLEGLEIYREIKDIRGIAANLGNLGKVEIAMNNYKDAVKYLKECIDLSKELGDIYVFVHGLENLSLIYLEFKAYDKACIFFSFSKSLFKELEIDTSEAEMILLDESLEKIKNAIGDEKFKSLYEKGSSMSIDEVYELSKEQVTF